ncbi:MAG TPA: class I SAM-dependent methyltransferase [Kofleriaceae bacterium]|nr:class I SAM-dependent methyltransferase [Kofleriaceae bacterium]
MLDDPHTSRFFVASDPQRHDVVLPLPGYWPTRPYEYAWAAGFAGPDHVVLDAACGICHPFKFLLSDTCAETHALDCDGRIVVPEAILRDVAADFGEPAAAGLSRHYFERIHFACASMTAMPYPDRMFDRAFCISALEHMPLPDIGRALAELARVVRDDGLILITIDYPSLPLEAFTAAAAAAGLAPAGTTSDALPPDAVFAPTWGVYCYRTVLRRAAPPA